MVEVAEGMALLSPPTAAESHLKAPFRLSCQTPVASDSGNDPLPHDAPRADANRTARPARARVARSALPLDPAVTRDGDRILIDGVGDRAVQRRRSTASRWTWARPPSSCACSISKPASRSPTRRFENPQRFGGSDVMSRIRYDTEHPGKLLRRTLAGYVTHAIEEFPVDPATIYEMVVVGNSTMRDLFFRQNVYSIGQTPYQSITEIEMADGQADDDEPDRNRPAVSAADSSQGARLRAADHQRSRRRRRGRVHAGGRHRARGSARRDHGHRHQHRAHRRQPASNPRGVLPGRSGVRRRRDLVRHAGARWRDRGRRDRRRRTHSRSA